MNGRASDARLSGEQGTVNDRSAAAGSRSATGVAGGLQSSRIAAHDRGGPAATAPELEARLAAPAVDPLWYKDAIIYEAHVKSFFDANNDGIGDFPGLTEKLPYLQDLGITCVWLLPFYPSPLKDDGYDISDYRNVHPSYGTLADFERFIREAHARHIRVLTELVVNHTSDQHPWFQAARRAPKGSRERELYVWSDTDQKFPETRIIFTDAEKSNWAFDPVAGQYYWHRFFSHQPDLNHNNPEVVDAVLDVMKFWFDLGVDAMRLDAVPYLCVREGTHNENLPETHHVLKRFRRELDAAYTGKALLAEANQWPADVRAYYGDGDECHMAFHFPLMPRMFMAVKTEDRHPITEILEQTPDIPETCQWAIFLRNHDELTLEMVTDEERDYMYNAYAADPQMRINVGIRRRLAPLMENSRRRIELMNGLLLSFPGTPILYYGDELGMGDNVYLGDRNGVRTPMQWTPDRNAGFSKADPARLFAPPVMDPVYGYEALNVEAQERAPFSLLNWNKRMIGLRKQHRVFGRGTLEFLASPNRKVLAYVRRYEQTTILCVANLSRTVQPAEIDLSRFAGLVPVEMLGQTEFPRIGDTPYFLTLSAYAFFWFELQEAPTSITARVQATFEQPPTLPALFAGVVWDTLLDGPSRGIVEKQALTAYIERQRWFGGKARTIAQARIVDWAVLRGGAHPSFLAVAELSYADGGREQYVLPLAMSSGAEADQMLQHHPQAVVAKMTGARKGVLYDGLWDDGTCGLLLGAIQQERRIATRHGEIVAERTSMLGTTLPADLAAQIARSSPDQSNTSVIFGQRLILKLFRRFEPGPNPDVEIGAYLTARHFPQVPPMAGAISYRAAGREPGAVVLLQGLVPNQGNGWEVTIDELRRYFDRVLEPNAAGEPAPIASWAHVMDDSRLPDVMRDTLGATLIFAERLGRRTAELHRELASAPATVAGLAPEPVDEEDLARWRDQMTTRGNAALDLLASRIETIGGGATMGRQLLARRGQVHAVFESLGTVRPGALKTRVHGDYHLGQVLAVQADVVILDFEGEPAKPLAERRAKDTPLRDVAGMLRSFGYASRTALCAVTQSRPDDFARLEPWALAWQHWTSAIFLRTYREAAGGWFGADAASATVLVRALMVDKALYELAYELNNRPDWVHVPLWGLLHLLEGEPEVPHA